MQTQSCTPKWSKRKKGSSGRVERIGSKKSEDRPCVLNTRHVEWDISEFSRTWGLVQYCRHTLNEIVWSRFRSQIESRLERPDRHRIKNGTECRLTTLEGEKKSTNRIIRCVVNLGLIWIWYNVCKKLYTQGESLRLRWHCYYILLLNPVLT